MYKKTFQYFIIIASLYGQPLCFSTEPADSSVVQDALSDTSAISDTLNSARECAAEQDPDTPISEPDTMQITGMDSIPAHSFQSDTLRYKKVNNQAFRVGEVLLFEIAYGVIKAGTAVMAIPDTQWVNGRPCYRIITMAKSNDVFDVFYKVRDKIQSLVDMEGLFTWKFEKHLREGRYRADRVEIYDQDNHLVYTHKDTIRVPPFIQDILASFYYTRTVPLTVGDHFEISNFGDGKVYPLKVLVLRKEEIKVPAGKFKCIVVEPVLQGEGLFKQEGRLQIWLTDDNRRIPVLLKSKIVVGSIDVRLTAIEHE